ncbi:MAG TPA: hypothetical protein VNH64_06225 [Parvularculaceae bacterium]|nr:hypothetical protein [Parvularculaceae bacterium]
MGMAERRSRAVLFVFALLTAAPGAAASPWTRDPGRLFVSTRTDYFLAHGEPVFPNAPARRFSRYDQDAYVEYGIARSTMLGAKVVYGTSTYSDGLTTATASGFSEVEGFVQRQVWRTERDAFAVKITLALPTEFATTPRPDLRRDGADLEIRALYGRNLIAAPVKAYASAEVAYRRRFGAASDQARADFLIGVEPSRRVLILLEALSTKAIGPAASGGGDYDIVKLQPSFVWRLARRWAFQAGLTHEAAGRNLILGDAWFAGLWTSF